MRHNNPGKKGHARPALSRRGFLKVVGLSGAGFMIGCTRTEEAAVVAGLADTEEATAVFGPFVRIGTDNKVTVLVKHLDSGQGVTSGLPSIVAEELDADWSQMNAEFAPADVRLYNNLNWGPLQGTGGSSSVANSWTQLRQAAAGARSMLVRAAASAWQVPPSEIAVYRGELSHASGRTATFGEMAVRAADMTPPAAPVLKDPADFTLIGSNVPCLDSASKIDGSLLYTNDIVVPGMLVAMVVHAPRFGAKLKSFDATASLAVTGVREVVEIPRGVAVVADSAYAAIEGRSALAVDWEFADAENRGTAEMFADYETASKGEGLVAHSAGDADASLVAAAQSARCEFRLPFLSHSPMEPLDCIAEIGPNACTLWTGCQNHTTDQYTVAELLGLQPEQVEINTLYAGGSFGRRASPDSDFIAEAVMVARAIDGRAPVKLLWTREDDMRGGHYRPMSYHVMEGGVDAEGNITSWRNKVTMQSVMMNTAFEEYIENGIDESSIEGSLHLPYAIPNLRIEVQPVENGVPVQWWRSVGFSQNVFASEVFFDELSHLAGKDPYKHRCELLAEQPRFLEVLDLAAEKAGWGESVGEDRGRGIAVHESRGTIVANVVDVTVSKNGEFTVDRVICAVDCGIAINPDVITAQMEGGIAFALSAALREEITFENGEVQQGNFDTYRPLRINEMPEVDVYIIQSSSPPTGVGEPGVPALAPALTNALFDATGKRIYRLPIGDQFA